MPDILRAKGSLTQQRVIVSGPWGNSHGPTRVRVWVVVTAAYHSIVVDGKWRKEKAVNMQENQDVLSVGGGGFGGVSLSYPCRAQMPQKGIRFQGQILAWAVAPPPFVTSPFAPPRPKAQNQHDNTTSNVTLHTVLPYPFTLLRKRIRAYRPFVGVVEYLGSRLSIAYFTC